MQPSDDFTVEVHRQAGATVVAPAGEIDVATVDRVRAGERACVTVVRGSRQLQRLFEIAGFGERLRLVDDPAEAA